MTSGAIAHGMGVMQLDPTRPDPVRPRPRAIDELQAASAVGQGKLYQVYDELLRARGITERPDPPDVLRHERPDALPQRPPDAAQAAGLARGPDHQRERHDHDRRDLVRQQRLPRGPGRDPAVGRAAGAADRRRGRVHGRPARRPLGRAGGARRGLRRARRARHRPRHLAAGHRRHALEGRRRRDGDRRRGAGRDRRRADAGNDHPGRRRASRSARASRRARGATRASSCG